MATASVFYKFKSQKEPTRVEFDGTVISVFDLKREIIIKSGLGDGTDFDLAIFNEDGKEEYDDDTETITRSTTVIARRLPAMKRGHGRAARYMTGRMPVHAKNLSRKEQSNKTAAKPAPTPTVVVSMNREMTEEEKMASMFAAQSEHWNTTQESMSKQTKVFAPGAKKATGAPDHEPPDGYVCYRCGEKGHWIQNCPTNDDPNFENKRRIKRTTGIPRSFLKTVDKPITTTTDGGEESKPPSGVMVNADGQFVIAEPDKASWEQFQAKTKSSAAAQNVADLGEKELQDRGLECSIDKRIFIDPMKTPCCEKTYCNDCITNALIESDFTCPGCQTDGVLIDDLKPDVETSEKIKAYLEEKSVAKKEKERSKSPNVKAESSAEGNTKSVSPSPSAKSPKSTVEPKSPSKSPTIDAATTTAPVVAVKEASKKRPADELLENPKIPKGPKAMQQKQATQAPNMMNGMNGFPNMPFDMSQNFYGNNGFNGPNMMNSFGMGMPNSFMPMNPMMGGMNFGGFPNMNGMNGMNGMNMFPNGGNFVGGMNSMGMGMMNGMGGGVNGGPNLRQGAAEGFPNQQKNVFSDTLPNEEDNAYFRKPVNPHRSQGRQRRARPSDYREL